MAASTQKQEWRRSPIGITPLSVRPRAGHRRVKKYDVEGAAAAGADASPPMAAGVQGKRDNSNALKVVVPGRAGAEGEGVTLAAAGAGREGRVCSVCARASADYSCPRCLVGYCSSKCYKVHGSVCTEAFFRGHVERETRLREGDEIERGSSGVKGPKAGRRASMVEVLRRIRLTDRGGDGNGGDADPHAEQGEVGEDEDGELMFQPERLEALALALKERGHTLPARPCSSSAETASTPAAAAAAAAAAATTASSANTVNVDAAVKASDSRGSKIGGSLPPSSSSDARAPSSSSRRGVVAGGGGELPWRGSRRAQQEARAGDAGKARPGGFSDGGVQEHEQQQQRRRGRLVDNGDDDEGMLDLLTEEEKGRFFREVASGRLGKLIVPWVPWWTQAAGVQEVAPITAGGRTSHSLPPPVVDPCRHHHHHKVCSSFGTPLPGGPGSSPPTRPATPEQPSSSSPGSQFPASRSGTAAATAAGEEEEGPSSSSSSSSCTRHSFAALLSQAFQAPGFSTINARKPSPTLPALATDLAYAYVLTSRLYNGCWCSDPVGASLALVGASPVLKDGATPATAAEALAACVERAVEGERAGFRGYAESLRQDVLQVCSDPRKLICAFQDAWVMLEAAGRTLAPSMAKASFLPASGKKAQRKAARELGKVEKRIGYFLLWARTHGEEVSPQMTKDVEVAVVPPAGQQRGIRMTA
ncbi:unnamed protein product [Ectocarpus fasciculatus]